MSDLVSIIIPVYNAAAHLEECINSAINQTWSNKEIIIIDDGSTDQSLNIANGYAHDHIKVFSQSNKGASAARNKGLQEARGNYIQFLDADDFLSKNKIAEQILVLNGSNDYLALCPTIHFFSNENPYERKVSHSWLQNGSNAPIDFLTKLYGGSVIGPNYGGMIQPNAWLVPRSIINNVGLWNESLTVDDDGEFFCRVILASAGIKYAPKAVNYYRKYKDGNSLSTLKDHLARKSLLKSWELKSQHLIPQIPGPIIHKVLAKNYTQIYFSFFLYDLKLSKEAKMLAKRYGGLTHQPNFGNKKANQLKKIFHWKVLLIAQKIYYFINYRWKS